MIFEQRTDSERLAVIEVSVLNIDKRLFGEAGRPGVIEQIHKDIASDGKRIQALENWRWWLAGIAIGIGAGGGFGFAKVLEAIVKN